MATKEKINLLEVIPCRNEHIKAEQEGETIVLSFPRFKRSWMSRYLLPKGMSKDIHVRLEEHGTAVWNLIDGQRTVSYTQLRIAVLSLNPHAGDGGLLGMEEQEIIIPAMKEMEEKGIICYGPYAADGFMGSGNYTHFDGILAMYHDQGLAPFKALAMEDGVNYTAGLPVVRCV